MAASLSKQMPSSACHEASMQMMTDIEMADMMAASHTNHEDMSPSSDEQHTTCNAICHLACTAYLAVPTVELVPVQISASNIAPYLFSFRSITSAPLLPPPLARV
jgi:hypothetical protein